MKEFAGRVYFVYGRCEDLADLGFFRRGIIGNDMSVSIKVTLQSLPIKSPFI